MGGYRSYTQIRMGTMTIIKISITAKSQPKYLATNSLMFFIGTFLEHVQRDQRETNNGQLQYGEVSLQ